MPLRFSWLQTAVHAGSQTRSTSIYLLHDDLDVPENLLVFAHSIKVVVDLLDLLGLLNDETFLLDDIIFNGLKKKVRGSLPLRSNLIEGGKERIDVSRLGHRDGEVLASAENVQ